MSADYDSVAGERCSVPVVRLPAVSGNPGFGGKLGKHFERVGIHVLLPRPRDKGSLQDLQLKLLARPNCGGKPFATLMSLHFMQHRYSNSGIV